MSESCRVFLIAWSLHFEFFPTNRVVDECQMNYFHAKQKKHSGWIRVERFHSSALPKISFVQVSARFNNIDFRLAILSMQIRVTLCYTKFKDVLKFFSESR